jgi:hypothetical protein
LTSPAQEYGGRAGTKWVCVRPRERADGAAASERPGLGAGLLVRASAASDGGMAPAHGLAAAGLQHSVNAFEPFLVLFVRRRAR